MWPRTVEFMLAMFLAITPFVFKLDPDQTWMWVNQLVIATLVAAIALASFSRRFPSLHFFNLVTAGWLLIVGYFLTATPPPPIAQNNVVLGLLIAMHAPLPNHNHQPPREWHEYELRRVSSDNG